jgi:C-terminal processing protease CtpA/Prc
LYWYTSKDSMDQYFNWGKQKIKDSLTEPQFKNILSYVLAKIDCGHTTARLSKKYSKYLDTLKSERFFPLSLKLWDDTAVVAVNLHRRDTILKRGTLIQSINNRSMKQITDTIFKFISSDGHNITHKNQVLSNRGSFGSMYTNVFGLSPRYSIEYSDVNGKTNSITTSVYDPSRDTINRTAIRQFIRPSRKQQKKLRIQSARSLKIDTASGVAFLEINSFGRGFDIREFFRKSFRTLQKNNIQYLIIDVRTNGGGSVTNSTLLSKYVADHKFKISDSLYAINRKSSYGRYIDKYFLNKIFMWFFTRKKKDGHYHFGYFERHFFSPKRRDHFNGKTYILTGGNSFSATTLFVQSVINQNNVTVVGEETGGGSYGNTAWLIPDVRLPETRVEFRLPLFRLVMDKDQPKTGRGIQPEVESKPTLDAIRKNQDYKLDKVLELINADKKASQKN